MKKRVQIIRPFNHHLVILMYLLLPLWQILLFAVNTNVFYSPNFLLLFMTNYGFLATLLLALVPFVALGLYFVHRISWYFFIMHSVLLLSENSYRIIFYPTFYSMQTLFTTCVILAIIGYVVQKNFRAPYFGVLSRSWRSNKRYRLELKCKFEGIPAIVKDISELGCFISIEPALFQLAELHPIKFEVENFNRLLNGEVMRISSDGVGLRFLDADRIAKKEIHALLNRSLDN